jgi:hypothetical protein
VIDQARRGRSAPDLAGLMPSLEPRRKVEPVFVSGARLAAVFDRGGGRFLAEAIRHYAAQLCPDFAVPKAVEKALPALSDPHALPPLAALFDRLGKAILITLSRNASRLGCYAGETGARRRDLDG